MVNYQGPKLVQGLMDALEIPIFNRIEELGFTVKDVNSLPVKRANVATLRGLQQFTVTQKTTAEFSAADVKTIEDTVPPGRIASVERSEKLIRFRLN